MKKNTLITILLALPIVLFAQNEQKLSPYTRNFFELQKNTSKEDSKAAFKKSFNISQEGETEYLSGFLHLKTSSDIDLLEAEGVLINSNLDSIMTVRIPIDKLQKVIALEFVHRFEMDKPVSLKMDKARVAAGVSKVHEGIELPQRYTGKNVVIGIIDQGFEYAHTNFYNTAGTTLRVKRVWNQNLSGVSALRPKGFSYGVEYKTASSIKLAERDVTNESHGTHVAGIAAGATSNGLCGVAPDADIVLVSTNMYNSGILDGVKYIYNYAESLGLPCVINLSLGGHVGPHDGTSLFDRSSSALQGEKKLLVGAAGNEGADNLHVSKDLQEEADTLKTIVVRSEKEPFSIDIWGAEEQEFFLKICIFNSEGIPVYSSSEISSFSVQENTISFSTVASAFGGKGSVSYASEKNPINNKGNIYLSLSQNLAFSSGYFFGIKVYGGQGQIHAWINDNEEFVDKSIAGFSNGDTDYTVGEIGGTGNRIISVGAYTTRGGSLNNIAYFSSKGPTVDGRSKPDVTAPGAVIYSSYNRFDTTNSGGVVKEETVGGTTYYYGRMQGTSMSSPFVTGVLALWLQEARFLTPEIVRGILTQSSTADLNTGTVPNNIWGRGKINAHAGMLGTFSFSSLEPLKGSSDSGLFCYPNPVVDKLNLYFAKSDKKVNLSLYTINGLLVKTFSFSEVDVAKGYALDIQDLSAGVYLLKIYGEENRHLVRVLKK